MELEKVLESIEKLVIKILILLVLVPKTLIVLLIKPKFCANYVTQQLSLKEEERFQEFVSPMLLLLFNTFLIWCTFKLNYNSFGSRAEDRYNIDFGQLTFKDLIYWFIEIAFVPLFLATFILITKKEKITSKNLIRPLFSLIYISCYSIYITIWLLIIQFIGSRIVLIYCLAVIPVFGAISMLIALEFFFREIFGTTRLKSFFLVLATLIITYFFVSNLNVFFVFLQEHNNAARPG